jgi:tRNA dimethylallyltransferase
MLAKDKPILIIAGPTCTGKSALAVDLALEFGGEIVNADSMQVYRYFNVGTAKPGADLTEKVPHHLIDIVEPEEEFNASIFKEKADYAIGEIRSRGKVPIIVGGTGLYLRVLLHGLFKVPSDPRLREELKASYRHNPLGLFETLKEIDPEYSMKISHKDKVRVVRAMEVYRLTGTVMSRWESAHGFADARYHVLKIALRKPREELYKRIDRRVEEMFRRGWLEEVKGLLPKYGEYSKPFSGIGYREIALHIKGSICYEDMIKDIKTQTRRYAKRQVTWFSKEKDIYWFEYPEEMERIKERAAGFLKEWISRGS